MYYGGDPPAWTLQPEMPPEALFKTQPKAEPASASGVTLEEALVYTPQHCLLQHYLITFTSISTAPIDLITVTAMRRSCSCGRHQATTTSNLLFEWEIVECKFLGAVLWLPRASSKDNSSKGSAEDDEGHAPASRHWRISNARDRQNWRLQGGGSRSSWNAGGRRKAKTGRRCSKGSKAEGSV